MKHDVLSTDTSHEQVHLFQDDDSGLKAIIAIHDSTLGNAMGGCRMRPYSDLDEALCDVLRLSEGMSYKCAMAGLPVGGGKSVIIGDPAKDKTHDLLKAMASAINQLNGLYIAAEDSGTHIRDMKIMQLYTPHIAGVEGDQGRIWEQNYGDPSPATAYGTLMGIHASVLHKLGRESLEGLRVNVQGLGNVGARVVQHLVEAGALVRVYDAMAARQANIVEQFGVQPVSAEDIIQKPADIFCPCALGAVINEESVEQLEVAIIAGAANNQLATEAQGQRLFDRGILYAPDFVINAGGIVDASMTQAKASSNDVNQRVVSISKTLLDIYKRSESDQISTSLVAEQMAKEKIAQARQSKICESSNSFSPSTKMANQIKKPNPIEQVAKRFKVPGAYC